MVPMWVSRLGRAFFSRRLCVVVFAIGVSGALQRNAVAQGNTTNCTVDGAGQRHCNAPAGIGLHGVVALVGSDGDGLWVGWQDATTGQCAGWDLIGNTSGFFNSYTVVGGTIASDYLATITSQGYEFCGRFLDPPTSSSSHVLKLDCWAGGYDYLIAYAGFQANLDCHDADGCYFELGGSGNIYGSPGIDYVVKAGSGTWNFDAGEGNDTINNYTSVSPTNGICGPGGPNDYDYYSGMRQGTLLDGCDVIE